MGLRAIAVVAVSMLALASCERTYEDQLSAFDTHVSKNRIGSAADVWLVKLNIFGGWERTALIFGYMDDFSFCNEVAELYAQRHPAERYTCQIAN